MEWLVAIHVLSAIIGIGPTFFGHVLFMKKQQGDQLRQSLALFGLLNYFPKIGGSLAVVSGVALVALSDWKFSDFWIWTSLVLYVLIQIVAVGMLGPVMKQLMQAINSEDEAVSEPQKSMNKEAILAKANLLYNTASILGVLLFILMIVKPM